MKIEFWKNKRELFLCWSLLIFISFLLVIVGIIMTIKDSFYWPMIMFALICLIISLLELFLKKTVLSKVIFSDKGIEWKRFKKKILFINWNEIIEIKPKIHGRNLTYLSFISGENQIEVDLTQKMYDTIMILCPNPNIKMMINNIDYFKCYHRKDKKK